MRRTERPTQLSDDELYLFVKESNGIEGILREPLHHEIEALRDFLGQPVVTLSELVLYVRVVSDGRLRDQYGMNVAVGSHIPPHGGPSITTNLSHLLSSILEELLTPYEAHCMYETLHPFTDGNGRSGRALWLWMMLREEHNPNPTYPFWEMAFLQTFYYQSLSSFRLSGNSLGE